MILERIVKQYRCTFCNYRWTNERRKDCPACLDGRTEVYTYREPQHPVEPDETVVQ